MQYKPYIFMWFLTVVEKGLFGYELSERLLFSMINVYRLEDCVLVSGESVLFLIQSCAKNRWSL